MSANTAEVTQWEQKRRKHPKESTHTFLQAHVKETPEDVHTNTCYHRMTQDGLTATEKEQCITKNELAPRKPTPLL